MSLLKTWVGTLVVASALSVAGCDDDDGGGAGNADDFVGAWSFTSGTIEPNCATVTVAPINLTGTTLTVTKVDGSHVRAMVTAGITCDATLSVSGSTATASPGGTCMVSVPMLGTATVSVTSWTLSLSGTSLASSLMGMVSSIVTCTPMSTGTLTKLVQ